MSKSSSDYIEFQKLLNNGYSIQRISVQLGTELGRVTIEIIDGYGVVSELTSSEDDVILLGFRWKSLHDKNGVIGPGFIRDTEEFYNNIDFLIDRDGNKLREAGERLKNKKEKQEYIPHDLIEELLTTESRSYKKYLPLRKDYYEILFVHTLLVKEIYDAEKEMRKKGEKYEKRLQLIYELMAKAFRQDPNFLKNYQKLQSFALVDIYDQLERIGVQIEESNHQMEMLVKAGGMKPSIGLKYPLEDYASKGEILINFMNIIRSAIELVEGNANPALKMKSTENWQIIRNHPKYKDIIGLFDPRIRHGKSHQSYVVDEETFTIKIYQLGRLKKLLVEYSFDEFRSMHQDLFFVLQTVSVGLCMEHAIISTFMLRSGEYKSLLIGLGNFKATK